MPGFAAPHDSSRSPQGAIAPAWHTALLVALICAVAVLGTLLSRRGIAVQLSTTTPSRGVVYVQLILVAWMLFFYVTRIGRNKSALLALIGRTWHSVDRAVADVALAAAGCLLIRIGEWLWSRFITTAVSTSVSALLPRTPLEYAGWILVSVSVGVAEEVVYRGYLQTQLAAFSRRASVGLIAQAVLFGIAHGDQGPSAMLRIAVYGLIFGLLARLRGSLIPGIVCHVSSNLVSGFLHTL